MIIMNVSGNVTADAIVRNVNGTEVVNFTVAHNRRYKTKNGEAKEEVTFISCSIWKKPETAKFFYKGRPVNVLGFLNHKLYERQDGSMHVGLNLTVSHYQLFGKNQPQEQTPHIAYEQNSSSDIPPAEEIHDLPF